MNIPCKKQKPNRRIRRAWIIGFHKRIVVKKATDVILSREQSWFVSSFYHGDLVVVFQHTTGEEVKKMRSIVVATRKA